MESFIISYISNTIINGFIYCIWIAPYLLFVEQGTPRGNYGKVEEMKDSLLCACNVKDILEIQLSPAIWRGEVAILDGY